MNDAFYIGYERKVEPRLARWIRTTVLVMAGAVILIAALLVTSQGPFADSKFEFGVTGSYEGEIVEWPYPMLIHNGDAILLTSPGKFGAASLVSGKAGFEVRLRGTLIERGGTRMLQVEPESLQFGPAANRFSPEKISLGHATLTGEIVDTKCFLGVMNPGGGKVHRDCAVRCISGGVPPGFLVRDASGEARLLLLVGSDGREIGREVLDWVAESITIPGNLVKTGSTLVLEAEPRDFQRE